MRVEGRGFHFSEAGRVAGKGCLSHKHRCNHGPAPDVHGTCGTAADTSIRGPGEFLQSLPTNCLRTPHPKIKYKNNLPYKGNIGSITFLGVLKQIVASAPGACNTKSCGRGSRPKAQSSSSVLERHKTPLSLNLLVAKVRPPPTRHICTVLEQLFIDHTCRRDCRSVSWPGTEWLKKLSSSKPHTNKHGTCTRTCFCTPSQARLIVEALQTRPSTLYSTCIGLRGESGGWA